MGSKRKTLLLSALAAILLTVCAWTAWSILNWYRFQRPIRSYSSGKLASAEGWKIHRSYGNKRVYQASIDSFSVERAKLGPFAIGPLQVAHLQEVVIDFYADGLLSDAAGDADPAKLKDFGIHVLEGPLADIRNDLFYRNRRIRIIEIKGISLNLWDGEKRVFSISSDRATIDRQSGDIIFVGRASLDAAENGNIISHRIRWVRKTSLFRIKDPFILTKSDRKKEGRELETDYRLKKITYRIEG